MAVYYRTNLTTQQLAPLCGVSSSTVCRMNQRLGLLLALQSVSRPADATDRPWIVDATLLPVRDRRVGAASQLQVLGKRAGHHGCRHPPHRRCGTTGAGHHCVMVVPHGKRPGRALLKGEEDDSAEHRKVRARVEHVIGRMKVYKVLRDCRQRGDGLHHAVQAVAHIATSPSPHEQVPRHRL